MCFSEKACAALLDTADCCRERTKAKSQFTIIEDNDPFYENSFMFSKVKRIVSTVFIVFIFMGVGFFVTVLIGSSVQQIFHVQNLFQSFVHLILSSNKIYLTIGVSCGMLITASLVVGAACIIKRAVKKNDAGIKDSGQHATFLHVTISGKTYVDYITEEKDKKPEGKYLLYVYANQTIDQESSSHYHHYSVASLSAFFTPFYILTTITYHAFRTCIIPFWIMFRCALKHSVGTPLFKGNGSHELKKIPGEMLYSIQHIIKAPFYGLALAFSALYMLVKPLSGRTLFARIEREWNDDLPMSYGFWLAPLHLGSHHSAYDLKPRVFVFGCMQHQGIIEFDAEGKPAKLSNSAGDLLEDFTKVEPQAPPEKDPDIENAQ